MTYLRQQNAAAHCFLAEKIRYTLDISLCISLILVHRATGGKERFLSKPIIVPLRRDFRLEDNPALYHAACGGQVIPVYVLDPAVAPPPKSASFWWLIQSLKAFRMRLNDRGVSLILRQGDYATMVANLAVSIGACQVVWNEGVLPGERAQDRQLKQLLSERNIPLRIYPANYLSAFEEVLTQQNTPYRLYAPFFQQILALIKDQTPNVLPEPDDMKGFGVIPSNSLKSWEKDLPSHANTLSRYWNPGEEHQKASWQRFLETRLEHYHLGRYNPDEDGHSSKLSAALHFGEISIRGLMKDLLNHYDLFNTATQSPFGPQSFFKQLIWREFSAYLLYHFPFLANTPCGQNWTTFPWRHAPKSLKSWQEGQSGYPIIDAGMRQLQQMGWIPHRVRMITASFLVKDLLVSWQEGAKWFQEQLVDADEANNSISWQRISGTGFDYVPFFRIYNPVTQSHKFDPDGEYIRTWLPELAKLPLSLLHAPWQTARDVLESFGVYPGENYPVRLVNHEHARQKALAIFSAWKKSSGELDQP